MRTSGGVLAVISFAALTALSPLVACSGGSGGTGGGAGGGSGGGSAGGGSGGGAGGGSADAGTVVTTISGATSGTRTDGPGLVAVWESSTNTTHVTFEDNGDNPFHAGFDFNFTGKPMVQTYDSSSAGIQAAVNVAISAQNEVWVASLNVMGHADAGTCTLQLTSVGPAMPQASNVNWYDVRGTVQATAPADGISTATGTVTANFTF
jgi:hypothetical protein